MDVSRHRLIEGSRCDSIQLGEIAVEHHAMAANDRAIATAERAIELDSTNGAAQQSVLRVTLNAGKTERARAVAERFARSRQRLPVVATCAYVLARTGNPSLARTLIAQIEAAPEGQRRWISLGMAYLGFADTTRSLNAFERAADTGEPLVYMSMSDPMFDAIRGSARFATVLRRYGFDTTLLLAPHGGRPY